MPRNQKLLQLVADPTPRSASYEHTTVSRFGAPLPLTRPGIRHSMISAYEHGRNAGSRPNTFKPVRRHRYSRMARVACWLLRLVANLAERLLWVGNGHAKACWAFMERSRPPSFIIIDPDTVASCVLTLSYFTLLPVFTAALAGLTQPIGRSSLPASFISMTICLRWPLFLWPALSALIEACVARDLYIARTCHS